MSEHLCEHLLCVSIGASPRVQALIEQAQIAWAVEHRNSGRMGSLEPCVPRLENEPSLRHETFEPNTKVAFKSSVLSWGIYNLDITVRIAMFPQNPEIKGW